MKFFEDEKIDRPPVICSGDMMNVAITEVLGDLNENHNADLDAIIATVY